MFLQTVIHQFFFVVAGVPCVYYALSLSTELNSRGQ